MNLEDYFKRIGYEGSFDTPDLATLKLIHKQHVMSVPFENLNIHCGERIVMNLEVTYDKIVRCNRGGWCLENNNLFGWVLRQMGYDCTSLSAKVYNTSLLDFHSFESHLIHKVVIDGKSYIADVSYGMSSQQWEPLELVSGKEQPQSSGVFCFRNEGDLWVLEKTYRKPKVLNADFATTSLVNRMERRPTQCFTLKPRDLDSLKDASNRLQTDPTSSFTKKSICCLQTPTGFRALLGWTYSEVTFKPEEGVDEFDMRNVKDDEIEEILRLKFNLKLQNKLTPVNKKSWYTM